MFLRPGRELFIWGESIVSPYFVKKTDTSPRIVILRISLLLNFLLSLILYKEVKVNIDRRNVVALIPNFFLFLFMIWFLSFIINHFVTFLSLDVGYRECVKISKLLFKVKSRAMFKTCFKIYEIRTKPS